MKNRFFVFDTNTLISSFLVRNSIPQLAFDKAREIGQIAVCKEVYDELCDVLIRPKFDRYIALKTRLSLLEDFKEIVVFIEPKEIIEACRDPKDDIYLSLAVVSRAECIVSGDKDLLVLNPFRGISIMNATEFLKTF